MRPTQRLTVFKETCRGLPATVVAGYETGVTLRLTELIRLILGS